MDRDTSTKTEQTTPSIASLPSPSSTPYPHSTWRLLVTPPCDGATNMAIDEAILHTVAAGHGVPTLRFFQWEPPCLSLGYNQHWEEVDEEACRRLGYTWTRRPTGGKAILHTDEVTYSLIIPQHDPRIRGDIVESYRILSFGLLRGLEKLGVQATQATFDERASSARQSKGGPVCFDTPSRYEITWAGKKLIGSAQLRRRKVVLQHGTLPLRGNLNRILEVLNFSEAERSFQTELLPQRATTLAEVLGRELSNAVVEAALQDGFAEELNLTLEGMGLTDAERDAAEKLRAEQYAHDSWNKRV